MAQYKIALIQADFPYLGLRSNLEKAIKLCNEAAINGARLVILPEAFYTGYIGSRMAEMAGYAEMAGGACISAIQTVARTCGVYIAAPVLQKIDGGVENSVFLVGDQGGIIGTYSKTHLTRFERPVLRRGMRYPIFDTPLGKIGFLICMDISYPEALGVLMTQGAELVILPAAWRDILDYRKIWNSLLFVRARDNGVCLAAVNRVGPAGEEEFSGESGVSAPTGDILCQAGMQEEIILYCEIDNEKIAAERERIGIVKNRHPEDYGLISQIKV